jgi:D-3-phosphoglycerate dehydrogenase
MILITTKVHEVLLKTLSEKELPYVYLPDLDYKGLLEIMPDAEGIIVSTQIKIDKTIIDAGKNLKWIGRLGSGMEHIDTCYAKSKQIICESSPEGNSNAVAEHALGLLLGFMRNTFKSNQEIKNNIWLREENRGGELAGKTIGIIGYGNTGSRLAKLLSSFDVNILCHDKYKKGFGTPLVQEVSIDTIQKRADIISIHLPLNSETKHFINQSFFNNTKKKPILINTSRGGIVDTNALIYAVKEGQLKGVILDVLENEDLRTYSREEASQFDFLKNHPRVVITPHIAGYTQEASYKLCIVLLEKLHILKN